MNKDEQEKFKHAVDAGITGMFSGIAVFLGLGLLIGSIVIGIIVYLATK